MTYAPDDLQQCRRYLLNELDMHPGSADADLDPDEVGIAPDQAHTESGGYHCGNDDLAAHGRLTSDYSKRESARDRPGSDASAALDIGEFDVVRAGRRLTLPGLTAFLFAACERGDPRTRDMRELIGSTDGVTVRHWDRLGTQRGKPADHLWHSHGSFHRDSEGRRARSDNFLGLLVEYVEGSTTMAGVDYGDLGGPSYGVVDAAGKPVAQEAWRHDHPSIYLADVWSWIWRLAGAWAKGVPDKDGDPQAGDTALGKWMNKIMSYSRTAATRSVPVTLNDADREAIAALVTARQATMEAKVDRLLAALGAAGDAQGKLNDSP